MRRPVSLVLLAAVLWLSAGAVNAQVRVTNCNDSGPGSLRAVAQSVPAIAGVVIQFPFYGGIFGMISKTPLSERLADLFIQFSTKESFPVVVAVYSAVLDLFLPSGGGNPGLHKYSTLVYRVGRVF